MRFMNIAIVLAIVLGAGPAAAGQRATATLVPVESGRIDAGTETVNRELCLRSGLFVLAFLRGTGPGMAHVRRDGDFVTLILRSDSDQDRWGWTSFSVDEQRTCFQLGALNGRARVYELRIGVDW